MKSLIAEIPTEKNTKRGWTVRLNGVVIKEVSSLKISHPNFGELNYGMTVPGYDGWSFKEIGGGGAITIPYVVIKGQLLVGLIKQNRHNQGGKVWNVPRGFINPDELHFEAAVRETNEELGYVSPDKRTKPLEGAPTNSNSAFFETAEKREGCRYYAMEILPSQLEKDSEKDYWIFKVNQINAMKAVTGIAKQIYDCKFVSWRSAVQVEDQFTCTAVARLLACQLCR